jgi:hypothetical protein
MLCRRAGILLMVAVPVLFWTGLLAIVGRALAIDIGPAGLTTCALVVGAVCLVAASAVAIGRTTDT